MILYFLCARKRKKDHAKFAKSVEKKKEEKLSENQIATLHAIHVKKLLTHLRLSDRQLGLLLNFGELLLKDGIQRVTNGLEE